jgi:anion-transporting  ArsA/GET3 family ATPase
MSQTKSTKLIVCVGSGGVGKTTSAAMIGLALAERGHKTVTITIDPARRLAQALGLESLSNDAKLVQEFASGGAFYAQWMDQKSALSDLVRKTTGNEVLAEKILRHRLFEIIEGHLGGVEEYLSLEKLLTIRESNEFDYCILDTAPSRHALDFLDSSKHLIRFFDEGILSKFLKSVDSANPPKSLWSHLLKVGQEKTLGLFKAVFGAPFFAELGELLSLSRPLHKRLIHVATGADEWIRSADTRVILVSAPDPRSFREVELMMGDLRARNLPQPYTLLLNRCLPESPPPENLVAKPTELGEKIQYRWEHQSSFLREVEGLKPWISLVLKYPEVDPKSMNLQGLQTAGREILSQWRDL